MAHIPYQFYMILCEIFLLTENISKYWIQDDMVFLNNFFKALKNLNLIPDFFKIFCTRGNRYLTISYPSILISIVSL